MEELSEERDVWEVTIYTFYRPPGSKTTIRADMPIDTLRIDRSEFRIEEEL